MYNGECLIAKVVDDETLVINRGAEHGLEIGQRLQVYQLGEEIMDPETNSSLGRLETIKGTGRVVHLQPKMATVKSDMKRSPLKTIRKPMSSSWSVLMGNIMQEEELLPEQTIPFSSPAAGDKARTV